MARKPPGTLTVSIPERYPQRLMGSFSAVGPITSGNIGAIALYNNAVDGTVLVLRDLALSLTPTSGEAAPKVILMFYFQAYIGGATIGSFPLLPNVAVGPGVISEYTDYTLPPYSVLEKGLLAFPITTGAYQWPHDWPLAFVPPTYSAIFISDGGAFDNLTASMIWEAAPSV